MTDIYLIKAQLSQTEIRPNDRRVRCDVTLWREGQSSMQRVVFHCTSRIRDTARNAQRLNTDQYLQKFSGNRSAYPALMTGHARPRQTRRGPISTYMRSNIAGMMLSVWHDHQEDQIVGELFIDQNCYNLRFTDALSDSQKRAGYEMDATWRPEPRVVVYQDGQYINQETGEIL